MSHQYAIRCVRCGAESESYNHAQNQLVEAVRRSYPLWLAAQAGWYVRESRWHDTYPLATFLVDHFEHGGFLVVSEYWVEGDPERGSKYSPIAVVPEVPGPGGYGAVVLPAVLKEARRAYELLGRCIGAAEAVGVSVARR